MTRPGNRVNSLSQMPLELLACIAQHLDDRALFSARCSFNRRIATGVDYEFAQRFFRTFRCRTTYCSFSRLSDLSLSRYSTAVRRVDFELGIRCKKHFCPYDPTFGIFETYKITLDDPPSGIPMKVSRVIRSLPNLEGFFIKAPRAVFGMRGGRPKLDWQDRLLKPSKLALISHRAAPRVHESDIDISGAACIIRDLLSGLQSSNFQPAKFGIIGFTDTLWQSIFASGREYGEKLSSGKCYGNVKTLRLELSTCRIDHYYSEESEKGSSFLATVMNGMPHLRTLALSLEAHHELKTLKQCWDTILFMLANTAVFHLEDLELKGVGNHNQSPASFVSLDRVIVKHKSSLRRVVLDRVVYRAPHSLQALFASLADTQVAHLALRNFDLYGSSFSRLMECVELVEDEKDLTVEDDDAYVGWVVLEIEPFAEDKWLIWYDMQEMSELLNMNVGCR